MSKLFDLIQGVLRSILILSLFTAAAAIAVTASAFTLLACARVIGLFWRSVFSFPWTF
jgi:hypothetical protein